jgi:hypothetical protein
MIEVSSGSDTDSLETATFLKVPFIANPWLGKCRLAQMGILYDFRSLKEDYFILNGD